MTLKEKIITTIALAVTISMFFYIIKSQDLNYLQLDNEILQTTKIALKTKSLSDYKQESYDNLIIKADKLLTIKNPSVMDKRLVPPSKNKHDYLSLSRYYWPNPNTKDSLPWIPIDGKINPYVLTQNVDYKNLQFLGNSLHKLSLAYSLSDEKKYAEKGVSMLKTWFLNKATVMNPNLKHSQIIPGNVSAQRSGILDGRIIPSKIIDAYTVFSTSKEWNTNNSIYINLWFEAYLRWLTKSKIGVEGAKQHNNHASWYQFQIAALGLHLGKKQLVKRALENTKKMISIQFNKKGQQIYEVRRTKPFAYSCFNLEAFVRLAIIGEKIGVDLWSYTSEDQKSLPLSIHYLMNVSDIEKHIASSDLNTLSTYVFILNYYKKKSVISKDEEIKIDKTINYFKQKIKKENPSYVYDYFYLLNE